ncbi:MAG: shikimate kinase [Candidatus Omnitrophota bacterium]
MGTGKTSVGKLLSKKLDKEFIEMDDFIEKREGKKIVEIFTEAGESCFRKIEKEVLNEFSTKIDSIVSCGGGLICNDDNAKVLLENGIVFCLTASAETIYTRTKKVTHRPLLNVADPLKKIKELLNQRASYYNKAHYIVDTDNIPKEEIADKIIRILKNR